MASNYPLRLQATFGGLAVVLLGFALWRCATIRDAAAAAAVGSAASEPPHNGLAAFDDGASAVGDTALAVAADAASAPALLQCPMPSPTLMSGAGSFQERVVGAPATATASLSSSLAPWPLPRWRPARLHNLLAPHLSLGTPLYALARAVQPWMLGTRCIANPCTPTRRHGSGAPAIAGIRGGGREGGRYGILEPVRAAVVAGAPRASPPF